ncbi:MAG TPA: hypothetical protein VFV99_14515 [Kofleriaceae bacterium]|nr:hypothetical protein [Kofleriaceae bacterium]
MRWVALLILCVACSDRYGAYLVVDSHGAVTFDRVEFYFGKELGGPLPTSPKHPLVSTEPSLVAKRLFVDADVQLAGGATTMITYYVPDQPENENLGRYVVVLAYSGDQIVGIGELFDFEVMTGSAVYRYDVDLVDARAEDIELWGRPTADCVRWTRDRGTGKPRTVAVVRGQDADCDSFLEGNIANQDCLPRVFCDGSGNAACDARVPCLTEGGESGCQVGTCSNKDGAPASCIPTTCVDENVCAPCDMTPAQDVPIGCALLNNSVHVDTPIEVNPDYTLCTEPYKIDMQMPVECLNPAIVSVIDYMPADPFTFSIADATGNTCQLTITPKMPGAHFTTVPHMMIAIDTPMGTAPRSAFIMGISANAGTCQTSTIMPDVRFGSCVP